ncbi:AVAST type 3 anti-phage nuclease/ATPase Avs3a [Propionispira raffinosivorans]|uniref:AVAST type 3 anti-phage nuclease/ATPase Avs3a n=1 Tax=Propionispira raffinosivorans TaxID=86959 RepID=UPI0003773CDB|nr:AVAST type 3 anti-phage nuclease/ATPase Avs3a [Propionispira raffinosivorans]
MSKTNLVRASRDGDQFHYLWAARRCLLLISPTATLQAVTIEGPSLSEVVAAESIISGEELIDVGEYYGSEKLEQATLIRYIQLKHSTVRIDQEWTPSELEKTLKGFAARYRELQQRLGIDTLNDKLEFWFVSNRPINAAILETIYDAAENVSARHSNDLKKLERFTSLSGTEFTNFCKLLHLDGNQEGLWDQQNMLVQDISCYLADADVDAPVQLKELVTRKALSTSSSNPTINRMDVLRALKTDESRLFPAPCLIKDIENVVSREQEPELLQAIVQASGIAVIVHAAGGIGKSVFATRIKLGLPNGSSSVLYDCFGNGQYRSASGYRHRHKDALVQIANELASQGLCHPLIPSAHSEPSDYMRAFIYRLQQSITSLRSNNAQALLCIIIDAADNAQMAAMENGEARSFVRDLIREQLPVGVRLVALCRTHRQQYLDPPPAALRLELRPFSRNETAAYLRQVFIDATEQDVDEFDRLSSHNPRVQALALSWKVPLNNTLRALGPNPTTVEDTIGNLLNDAVARLCDAVGTIEKTQIDRICAGLAVLRPLIPLSVLASMAEVKEGAIKSFAFDLGRPLLVIGDTIQFFDEPAETWFRDRFKPTSNDLARFVDKLKPLAASSSYVASALPQLMLEAGQFAELVVLALSSQALPSASPIEKRDIELQRLQFALKASLRAKHYTDAAKLALKAGGESAGNERQRKILQDNIDLATVFLESDRIQEIVSRKTFGSGWIGSHHAYEAALLSGRNELLGDARSRLRMASEWLKNWSKLPHEERKKEEVSDNDILEMASAFFNIYGADRCAGDLRRWHPREVSFRVGRILASRFIDHGRYQDLNELALAAGNNLCLILAITLELREVHRVLPKRVMERAFCLALNPLVKLKDSGHWDNEGSSISAVTALAEAAYKLSIATTDELIALLTRYLPLSPPRSLSSRFDRQRFLLLRAYALRAALSSQSLNLIDLAHDELRKELEASKSYSESQDAREFKESIGSLLPWYRLWSTIFLGQTSSTDLANDIAKAKAESAKIIEYSYQEISDTSDEIARIWFDTLLIAKSTDTASVDVFNQWINNLKRPLFTTTLTHLARLAARSPMLEECAFDYVGKAFDIIRNVREDAESKSDSFVKLARAILTVSSSEAAAYFNQAVEVASRIGDENLDRWGALLELTSRAASRDKPNPMIAYRLARCTELTYDYVVRDKYFDWEATIKAISGLCGKSSLAILSRWRDRDFGSTERILPIAVNFLVARGDLDPKIALALIGFRVDWNEPFLLNNYLEKSTNKAEREAVTALVYRYMTLERQSVGKWRELKSILGEYGIVYLELDERIKLSECEEKASKSGENCYGIDSVTERECKDKRDWNEIFKGLDLSIANDIWQAHQRFKDFEPPYYHEYFFEEMCSRVNIGKEAEFITAISDVGNFDLYHLRILLEYFPEKWKSRLAVKSALVKTLRVFCRRFCMTIAKSRYYEALPIKTTCELVEITEDDVIDMVLTAVGEVAEVAGADRLFTLVGLLAPKLTESEALEVLSFGLDLFEPVLEDSDGDGSWSCELEPPSEIEGSVAGYIWGCLAAPRASLRWEAAHVVRALCTFGDEKVIEHLVKLASGTSADAFYDAHLHFYERHARQWLLTGLARAANDHPNFVAPYGDFLIKVVFDGEPHFLIREFAKRTILTLLDAGFLESQADLRHRITAVNTSPFSLIESKSYQRLKNAETDAEDDTEDDKDRFYFGIDIGPYWLAPLGRCFAKSQTSIERDALQLIRNDWHISGGRRLDEDERHRRKIFKGMQTHHSHGSYPRVDELRFYLSYHAMMVVAGNLLATTPVHHDPDDSEDDFQNWLKHHDLSRWDGGWIADRRDPIPLERPTWKDEKETKDWRWSIARNDFDRVLIAPGGRINIWGRWTLVSGRREESICVYSALVSSERSMALLRALQSVDNPHDYRIPDADDDLQINFKGFELKGWILDKSCGNRLDEQDPWAGSIMYPSLEPAAYIIDLMKLNSDAEHRRWFVKNDSTNVAWSQVWGHFQEKDDNEASHESGKRFQVSFEFLVSLLQELKMDLIVEVEIERRCRYSRWEGSNNDDIGFIPSSARLFLIKSDSSISTL